MAVDSASTDTQLLRVVCAQTNFRVKVRLHPKLNNDTQHNKATTTQSASQKSTHSSTGQPTTAAVGVDISAAGASAVGGVGGVVYDGQEEVTHLLESGSVIEVYTELVDGFYKLIDNQVYYYVYMLLKHI